MRKKMKKIQMINPPKIRYQKKRHEISVNIAKMATKV